MNWRVLFAFWFMAVMSSGGASRMKLADGFDFPVGKPEAKGYYKARGLRLRPPLHFGEDWNGTGGGAVRSRRCFWKAGRRKSG